MNARFLGANIKMLRLFQHQGPPTSQLDVLSFPESEYPVAGSRLLPPLHLSHLENYRLQGGRTLELPSLSLGIGRRPMNRSDDLSGLADMPFTIGNSLPPRLVHPWPALMWHCLPQLLRLAQSPRGYTEINCFSWDMTPLICPQSTYSLI